MNAPSWMKGPPRAILLATDLGPRCDRALDRAAALADQWQAKLVVVHVLEETASGLSGPATLAPSWKRPPDPVETARRQLLADIGAVAERATLVIETGDPAEAILRTAEAEGCDLVVTGTARDELLGRFALGKTVDRLLRRSRVPLLVVKNRARRPYTNIVVATDFSDSSRHAVEAATRFFPERRLTLFHAYHAPMSGITTDPVSYQKEYAKIAMQECEAFLRRIDGFGDRAPRPDILLEHGEPDRLLWEYAHDKNVDLVVLGTHGRSAIFEIFLGSVAKEIMGALPCDALVIREPRAAAEG